MITPELIPLLNSAAGSCLTYANLQNAGIATISLSLAELLMKPGIAFLETLESIRCYYNWPGNILINGSGLKVNSAGVYKLRSFYDGQLITISNDQLRDLISRLRADKVFWPMGEKYAVWDGLTSFAVWVAQWDPDITLIGDFGWEEMAYCSGRCVLTDKPAHDALQGVIYTHNGCFDILAETNQNHHGLLENACGCKTCSEKLTRAYCHHLLQHTPLLAQRYLIQHNLYYCQQAISRLRETEMSI